MDNDDEVGTEAEDWEWEWQRWRGE